MSVSLQGLFAVGLALVLALVLTPLVRYLARRGGMVSRPRSDRWAKKPTALLGGVAIFAAMAVVYLTLLPPVEHGWVVFGASAFLFLVGLVDDFRHVKPYQKLVGQIMGAALVILGGLTLPWTSSSLLNMALTLFWLVGITNAINLLDNMDGLAAGVSAIAAAFLSATFFAAGDPAPGLLLAALAATLLGFLVYNFNPASIFMGDCGSLFIGFFLGSAALMGVTGGRVRGLLPVLTVPVLLLLIPIFDTTLVTVLRKLAGRPASQGGRDHTSHRLVALGLSERRAVGLLYGLAVLSGLMALFVRRAPADISLALIAAFTLALTLLGVHLARVKVYEDVAGQVPGAQPLVGFLVDLSYKRRLFEVLLDVVLIGLSYYGANLLVFGPLRQSGVLKLVASSLPVLVSVKLAVFLALGVYRGLWRYLSVSDLLVYFRAVAVASAASVLVLLFLFRFEGFSRVVFVLDGLLLLVLVCGSRFAFRLLRWLLPHPAPAGLRRTLIYGAGDGGELLLRELRNNRALRCVPVGFADDDPLKKGKVIHGLQVFGGNGSLQRICREQRIDLVFISSRRFPEARVREILKDCETIGAGLKRLSISLETLHDAGTPGDAEGDGKGVG
jgi:UDP-GlcNAc:undecaprenyl-phosphate GlcNAc-1-phosphate transferase